MDNSSPDSQTHMSNGHLGPITLILDIEGFEFYRRMSRAVFRKIREDDRIDPADIPKLFGRRSAGDTQGLNVDNFIMAVLGSIRAGGLSPREADAHLQLQRTRFFHFTDRCLWQWKISYSILENGEQRRMKKTTLGCPGRMIHPEMGYDVDDTALGD